MNQRPAYGSAPGVSAPAPSGRATAATTSAATRLTRSTARGRRGSCVANAPASASAGTTAIARSVTQGHQSGRVGRAALLVQLRAERRRDGDHERQINRDAELDEQR